MRWKDTKKILQRVWHFIWEENSIWSWIVNIILAFIIIKFIIYPGMGLAFGTQFPIVAVESGSMEHYGSFDEWWEKSQYSYAYFNITNEQFGKFILKNGFSKGDIIILRGAKPENIEKGDIIVFKSLRPHPIIHRVVNRWQEGGSYYFQTKGDNYRTNPFSLQEEMRISSDRVVGKAVAKIPYLGYIKIWFTDFVSLIINR